MASQRLKTATKMQTLAKMQKPPQKPEKMKSMTRMHQLVIRTQGRTLMSLSQRKMKMLRAMLMLMMLKTAGMIQMMRRLQQTLIVMLTLTVRSNLSFRPLSSYTQTHE